MPELHTLNTTAVPRTATLSYTQYNHEKYYTAVKNIFSEAFPEYSMSELKRCVDLTNRGIIECTLLLSDNIPAGFIFYKEYPEFYYCEYVAVAAAFRGKRYGHKLLGWAKSLDDKQWIFEIEITEKCGEDCPKIKLFRREGIIENTYEYSMPRIEEIYPNSIYRLWSRYPLTKKKFDEVVKTLKNDPDF